MKDESGPGEGSAKRKAMPLTLVKRGEFWEDDSPADKKKNRPEKTKEGEDVPAFKCLD